MAPDRLNGQVRIQSSSLMFPQLTWQTKHSNSLSTIKWISHHQLTMPQKRKKLTLRTKKESLLMDSSNTVLIQLKQLPSLTTLRTTWNRSRPSYWTLIGSLLQITQTPCWTSSLKLKMMRSSLVIRSECWLNSCGWTTMKLLIRLCSDHSWWCLFHSISTQHSSEQLKEILSTSPTPWRCCAWSSGGNVSSRSSSLSLFSSEPTLGITLLVSGICLTSFHWLLHSVICISVLLVVSITQLDSTSKFLVPFLLSCSGWSSSTGLDSSSLSVHSLESLRKLSKTSEYSQLCFYSV